MAGYEVVYLPAHNSAICIDIVSFSLYHDAQSKQMNSSHLISFSFGKKLADTRPR